MASTKFVILQLVGLLLAISIAVFQPTAVNISPLFSNESKCPVPEYVGTFDHNDTQFLLHDKSFRKFAAERLSRAIQIDTVVDEHMTDFSKFIDFHNYLQTEFPLVYQNAIVTKINDYGLVYEFKGTDSSLKPILMMAHQDTVPFGDLSEWEYHPLSGHFDDEIIYGRGSNDIKGLLVGLMGAMTEIYQKNPNHKLNRTVIFAFGYDEEISGDLGAKNIANYLFEKYGPDSIDHILDEGAPMCIGVNKNYYGFVVTAEKGYLDLAIEVNAPSGHSSNPTDKTSIGLLSEILSSYEKDKFKPIIPDENPMLNLFECVSEQSKLPFFFKIIAKLSRANELAKNLLINKLSNVSLFEYTIRTSQAIDVISGGTKYNALPYNATAVINHRIAVGDNEDTVLSKAIKHSKIVAIESNLGLLVNDKVLIEPTKNGVIKIRTLYYLPVAPITPIFDDIWNRLTGFMRNFYEREVFPGKFIDTPYIITPTTMQGNTDTRHYWKLSTHIYRSQPGITNLFEAHMHGTNEYVHIDSHLQVIAFYYNYILNIC